MSGTYIFPAEVAVSTNFHHTNGDPFVGVAPDQPRPFPIGRDRRGWASPRSQARTVGEVQVQDADASSEPGCSRD